MKIYVDTAVIIAFFDEKNHFYQDSCNILTFPNIEFVTGLITLIELESVISRNFSQFQLSINLDALKEYKILTESQKISFLASYLMKWAKVLLISSVSIEKISVNDNTLDIDNITNLALKINRDLKLRTLDALQIASAITMRISNEINVDYFLTNDSTILNRKQEIYQKSRILPVSSDELWNLLKSK